MIDERDLPPPHGTASPCRAGIFYGAPSGGNASWAAYCSCGWFGAFSLTKKRALREAHQHALVVDTQVHGLEAKGLPPGLRGPAPGSIVPPPVRRGGDAEGLIRILTRVEPRFRRVVPPEKGAPRAAK